MKSGAGSSLNLTLPQVEPPPLGQPLASEKAAKTAEESPREGPKRRSEEANELRAKADSEWEEHWDDEAQAFYWYNFSTGEASWIAPPELRKGGEAEDQAVAPADVDDGWERYWDEVEQTWYYLDLQTGETYFGDDKAPHRSVSMSNQPLLRFGERDEAQKAAVKTSEREGDQDQDA